MQATIHSSIYATTQSETSIIPKSSLRSFQSSEGQLNRQITPEAFVNNCLSKSESLLIELQLLRPIVLAYCLSFLRHSEDAQEACQDTMLKAIASLPKFEYRASLKTWVMKIAYHVCADYYRKKRVQDALFDEFDDAEFLTDELAVEEDNPKLTAILATLSDVQREILRYRFVDELPLNKISIVLGHTLSRVKMNYYRALEKLQKAYIL